MSKPDGKTILDQNEVATNYDSLYYIGYFVILLGFVPSVIYYFDLIQYLRASRGGLNLPVGVYYEKGGMIALIYYPVFVLLLILFYRNFNVAKFDRRLYFMIALLIILLVYNEMIQHIGSAISVRLY